MDALFYYPRKLISSSLFGPIYQAALTALTLEQIEPLTATLHYLRDLLAYGGNNPPSSESSIDHDAIRPLVQKLVVAQGEVLVQRVMAGMMFTFPKDCFPDASGVLLDMVQLVPTEITRWIAHTVQMLPVGTVNQVEVQRLITQIDQYVFSLPPRIVCL